jgi:hypothetical protein
VFPAIQRILKGRRPVSDDVEQRRTAWNEATTRWIDFVRPVRLHRAGTGMAREQGGVLVIRLETADMLAMLSGGDLTAEVPLWLSFSEFTALLSETSGLPPETAERWAARIQRLDPRRDVVLFLVSRPDAKGRSFSRIIAIPGAIRGSQTAAGPPGSSITSALQPRS